MSESVIAMTARPTSLRTLDGRLSRRHLFLFHVAKDDLEHDHGVVDHDADREGEGEQRDDVQGKAHPVHCGEGRDESARDGNGGDDGGPDLAEEEKHDPRGEDGAENQMLFDGVHRREDVLGLVANRVHLPAARKLAPELGDPLLEPFHDLNGVRAGLLAHLEHDGGLAVEGGDRLGVGHAVFDARDVADAYRITVPHRDGNELERLGRAHPTISSEGEVAGTLLDLAARELNVLASEGGDDLGSRETETGELGGVDDDVDLPRSAAHDPHLPHAQDGLDLPPERLVGELRDVTYRSRAGKDEREHRRGVGIDLRDDGWIRVSRQIAEDAVDAIAHFLGSDVAVLFEIELNRDDGVSLRRDRDELVDTADGVDRFFDLVGDLGLDLFGSSAHESRRDRHEGEVHVREAIDAEVHEGEQAHDDERENEHRREDRTAYAKLG